MPQLAGWIWKAVGGVGRCFSGRDWEPHHLPLNHLGSLSEQQILGPTHPRPQPPDGPPMIHQSLWGSPFFLFTDPMSTETTLPVCPLLGPGTEYNPVNTHGMKDQKTKWACGPLSSSTPADLMGICWEPGLLWRVLEAGLSHPRAVMVTL